MLVRRAADLNRIVMLGTENLGKLIRILDSASYWESPIWLLNTEKDTTRLMKYKWSEPQLTELLKGCLDMIISVSELNL